MVLASRSFFGLHHSTRMTETPSTALLGGHTSAPPHWIRAWAVQISGWQLRSRHMLWSRQRTYIQLIVLQEVCTPSSILLKSVTSEPPAFYVCPSIYLMARNFGGLVVLSAISQYFIRHQFYSNWAETSSWPVKFSIHSISHFVMDIIIAKTGKVNSAK